MLIWTDNAISHIQEFIKEARTDTEKTAKAYMNKLVDYADSLDNMPKAGKKLEIISNYELRQLIYKSHRIIYTVKAEDIVVLAVLHTRLDIENSIKKMKRNFKL